MLLRHQAIPIIFVDMKKGPWKYYLLALFVILIDQALKLWVHTNMQMGPQGAIRLLGDWFKLHYTLNPGMAFGIQFGFRYGKLVLTLGRLVATFVIGYHMWRLWQGEAMLRGQLWGWALVLGGAIGNVIDSILYAVLLDNAPYNAPMTWFHGQVIDMLYLDLWEARIPGWVPLIGNSYFAALPIFNLADTAIFLGILLIFWARRKMMQQSEPSTGSDTSEFAEVAGQLSIPPDVLEETP